ncbi:cytochrome c oxidase assembly protein [Rhodobacter sp. SGA-6-6]|uniref:cytochrome c oxidase assembly protein n=1 Tax=Rhodobacter sp. SGA-6-6 TaxID=2710882 RepID=UPI0013EB9017|nr:cytochrome c oxidase assembly protein [Rhodobacter sp. SGA-6-6]NGM46019.1 cytochrome c oxidase assembly protein [Rhodobacter sp. SGA-6-6]
MDLGAFQGIYCGPAPDPAGLWMRWNLDPGLLVALVLLALLLRRSGAGLAGVAVLAIAFVSPLCALSAALFSARVVHHVALVVLAAPLIAAALPLKAPGSPVLPFVVHAAVLWLWHLPAAYDLALGNTAIYWAMQATLLGSAVVYWAAVLNPRLPPGLALGATLAGYMQMALLGALLTFAPAALYGIHATAPLAFGLLPLTDQQLGGLIMWVPAGLPFLVIGGMLARRGWQGMGRPA